MRTSAPILQVVLVPVFSGLLLRRAFPAAVDLALPFLPLAAGLFSALTVGGVVARNAATVLASSPAPFAAVLLLHVGGFAAGYAASRVRTNPGPGLSWEGGWSGEVCCGPLRPCILLQGCVGPCRRKSSASWQRPSYGSSSKPRPQAYSLFPFLVDVDAT